jgi:hypothetical protein
MQKNQVDSTRNKRVCFVWLQSNEIAKLIIDRDYKSRVIRFLTSIIPKGAMPEMDDLEFSVFDGPSEVLRSELGLAPGEKFDRVGALQKIP